MGIDLIGQVVKTYAMPCENPARRTSGVRGSAIIGSTGVPACDISGFGFGACIFEKPPDAWNRADAAMNEGEQTPALRSPIPE
jgi:hypothetical protein